jgi:hypothetical protein
MGYKVEVNLSKKQALIVKEALNLYSRLLMGQVEELSYFFGSKEISDSLSEIKSILFPELENNSYYGIYQKDCSQESKIAYDIIQVLRNKIAWHENPEGKNTVSFAPPLRAGDESLCEVKIIV